MVIVLTRSSGRTCQAQHQLRQGRPPARTGKTMAAEVLANTPATSAGRTSPSPTGP